MANLKTKVRSLYIAQETTFGVDPSASGALYTYVHGIDVSLPKFTNEVIAGAYQNDELVHSPDEIGAQKGSLTLKLPIRASGTPSASPSTPAIACEADLFLQTILGAVTRGQSSAISGANASATNVLVTASGGFIVGGLAYCAARNEVRPVSAIPDGTHVTVSPAFGGIPTTGDLVAGSYYTPAKTGHKSLSFNVKIDTLEVTFLGGRPTAAKIANGGANGRPLLEMGFEYDSYSITAKGSLPVANDVFSVKPAFLKGSPFFLGGVQTVIAGMELDLGAKFEFSPATEGTQGRSGFEAVDYEPKGMIEPYYAAGYLTDFQAGTIKTMGLGVGNQNTGWGWYASNCQYTDHEIQDKASQLANKIPFAVKDPNTGNKLLVLTVF